MFHWNHPEPRDWKESYMTSALTCRAYWKVRDDDETYAVKLGLSKEMVE